MGGEQRHKRSEKAGCVRRHEVGEKVAASSSERKGGERMVFGARAAGRRAREVAGGVNGQRAGAISSRSVLQRGIVRVGSVSGIGCV
jgi:hypothetical protein